MASVAAAANPPVSPSEEACTGFSRGGFCILLLCLPAAAVILYCFPPGSFSFYPVCPIHEYLHILCPGCGATRAFSALLHGHVIAALRLNALAILVLLPLAAVYGAIGVKRWLKHEALVWPSFSRPATIALIVLAVAFTLVRNL